MHKMCYLFGFHLFFSLSLSFPQLFVSHSVCIWLLCVCVWSIPDFNSDGTWQIFVRKTFMNVAWFFHFINLFRCLSPLFDLLLIVISFCLFKWKQQQIYRFFCVSVVDAVLLIHIFFSLDFLFARSPFMRIKNFSGFWLLHICGFFCMCVCLTVYFACLLCV